jgi:uncharacterized protein DUF4907
MTIKHSTIVLAISIVIAIAIPFFYLGHKKNIDYKIIHTSSGWGYDILVDKKLIIHQECVPVLAEKKGFPTEESAKAVAKVVVQKLKNNEQPTITYDELTQVSHN